MTIKKPPKPKSKIIFGPAEIEQVESLSEVLNQDQISRYFKISPSTLQAIFKRQPEVYEAYQAGVSKMILEVGKSLIKQAKDGNIGAAIFIMKTRGGWKETSAIDVNVKNSGDTVLDYYTPKKN